MSRAGFRVGDDEEEDDTDDVEVVVGMEEDAKKSSADDNNAKANANDNNAGGDESKPSAFEKKIIFMEVGDEPTSGDNVARVKVRLPDGNYSENVWRKNSRQVHQCLCGAIERRGQGRDGV